MILAIAGLAVTAPAALADNQFFKSPSGNIVCEMDDDYAYCVVFSIAREMKVTGSGRVSVTGRRSDPPSEAVPVLRYGRSVTRARVRCTSKVTGMRCVSRSTGHGFLASRSGVVRF